MTVDTSHTAAWFESECVGRLYRRPNGQAVYRAEKLWFDRSYERHYNFVHTYVRLRNTESRKTMNLTLFDFRRMVSVDS
jgi:uncharacterized C2H2 Zn-finger protein